MTQFPPSRPAPGAPDLVGREGDLAAARAALDAGARLLTLVGPGGVGKTALARALGGTVVEFAGAEDADAVAGEVARAVGLPSAPGRCPLEVLRVHGAGRAAPVVLDNLEHLAGAEGAVEALLGACPGWRFVATSRRALGLPQERTLAVAPLDLPPPGASPAEVLASAAGRLFVRVAMGAAPSFALTPVNAPAVAELCRRLDGLPLALELVARRAALFPPEALLSHLRAGLDTAPGAGRRAGGAARHASLSGVARWSDDLLDPALRAFFHRLGVFPDAFSPEEAARVAASPGSGRPALAALVELAEHSLAVALPDGRFRLLETLRTYTRARLAEGPQEERRALDHRLGEIARDLAGTLTRRGLHPELAARVDARLPIVREVLANLLAPDAPRADAAGVALAADVCAGLAAYWETRGEVAEGRRWCARLLTRPELAPRDRARALCALGTLATAQGDAREGRALCAQAAERAEALGDAALVAAARRGEARALLLSGEAAKAEALLEDVLARGVDDPDALAATLGLLGSALASRGDLPRARAHVERSLAAHRALDRPWNALRPLLGLAGIEERLGNLDTAAALHDEARALARDLGDTAMFAAASANLGILRRNLGDAAGARALHEEALAAFRASGHALNEAHSLCNLASVATDLHDLAAARAAYGGAIVLYRRLGQEHFAAQVLADLAVIETRDERPAEARALLAVALPLLEAQEDWTYLVLAAETLGSTFLRDATGEPNDGTGARLALGCFAAAEALGEARGVAITPLHARDRAEERAAARARLDATAARAAWRAGRALDPAALRRLAEGRAEDAGPDVNGPEADTPDAPLPAARTAAPLDLSPREQDVLRLLVRGLTNKRVAADLGLSPNTVRRHVASIMDKTGCRTRTEIAHRALEGGWLEDPPG